MEVPLSDAESAVLSVDNSRFASEIGKISSKLNPFPNIWRWVVEIVMNFNLFYFMELMLIWFFLIFTSFVLKVWKFE